ncbi:small integral membrane protein 20-like [Contarinia nasturtii]|uniref:small integral membrane protein 20-like n=1 Tax=Contarinia nasturtii TaxID=265458 RepID=UPI0012D4244B|nr:small integral membrane protein 20-like [Contarinia nasturtii]
MIRPKRKFWSSNFLFIGIAGTVLVALIPIFIEPYLNSKKYNEIQKKTRANIIQEDVQPGNMRVWSDPFGRKKDDDE